MEKAGMKPGRVDPYILCLFQALVIQQSFALVVGFNRPPILFVVIIFFAG
jgi:hypothetical protein